MISAIRRFLDFLAKMGLSVRDDPPRIIDPRAREWGAIVDGFALSVSALDSDAAGGISAISIALRNVSLALVTLNIPAWLFFYRIEISESTLTPYGRASLNPARQSDLQIVVLASGAMAETQIPLRSLYALRPGVPHEITVSCQLPTSGSRLSVTSTII